MALEETALSARPENAIVVRIIGVDKNTTNKKKEKRDKKKHEVDTRRGAQWGGELIGETGSVWPAAAASAVFARRRRGARPAADGGASDYLLIAATTRTRPAVRWRRS